MSSLKKIIAAVMVAAGLCGCEKKSISSPELYVSFKADGSARELRIDGSQTVFYTTKHTSTICMPDSAQAEYGCDYQLYSGSNLSQDVIIYFYLSDSKNNLAQYNGLYYYEDLEYVSARLAEAPLNYLRSNCASTLGVGLYYYDSGIFYRSNFTANSDSSFFRVTRSEIIEHPTFGTSILLEGLFECKVRSLTGDSVVITEGRFSGVIDNLP
ncbi:MAG TPA: hypothetical protein VNJ07_04690 [Chitinophagales bacterium]|nr:hypothetical protein [Chitinophagales bacterium]